MGKRNVLIGRYLTQERNRMRWNNPEWAGMIPEWAGMTPEWARIILEWTE